MKAQLYLPLIIILLSSCDPLKEGYFIPIFGLEKVDIERSCSDNNLSVFSEGKAIEIYKISDETFNSFISSEYQTFPKENQYSRKFSQIMKWKKTPVLGFDSIIFNIHDNVFENSDCFSKQDLFALLNDKGSYYAFYNSPPSFEYFMLFILEERTNSLYLIQNTW